jgi:hypothetical protein
LGCGFSSLIKLEANCIIFLSSFAEKSYIESMPCNTSLASSPFKCARTLLFWKDLSERYSCSARLNAVICFKAFLYSPCSKSALTYLGES